MSLGKIIMNDDKKLIRVFINTEIIVHELQDLLKDKGIFSLVEKEMTNGFKARFLYFNPDLFNLYIYKIDLLSAEPIIKAYNNRLKQS